MELHSLLPQENFFNWLCEDGADGWSHDDSMRVSPPRDGLCVKLTSSSTRA